MRIDFTSSCISMISDMFDSFVNFYAVITFNKKLVIVLLTHILYT